MLILYENGNTARARHADQLLQCRASMSAG